MDDAEFDRLLSSLTPRERGEGVRIYQNTVGLACPACEEPFDDCIVSTDEFNRFDLTREMDLCVTVHDDDPVLFTHRK